MDNEKSLQSTPLPDLSGAIEKLLAHPELLSSVASVLGAPTPRPREEEPSEEVHAPSALPETLSAMTPLLSALSGGKREGDPRTSLLLALKPYLSPRRCDTIDTLLRLAPLADLLRAGNQSTKGGS